MTLRCGGRIAAVIGTAVLLFYFIVRYRNSRRAEWTQKACGEWKKAVSEISRRGPRPTSTETDGLELDRALTRREMVWLWDARASLANHPIKAQELVPSIADPAFVGLTESADVLVIGRDMPFYGHGYVTHEDLFTRSGRASWLLHEVTGRSDEPSVPRGTNRIVLADRLKSWDTWFRALDGGRACFAAR